jgi:thiol-disulfide isomerase/thioredoxin
VDEVPGLVDEGDRFLQKKLEDQNSDDRQDMAANGQGAMHQLKISGARILLDYFDATNQPDKARELDAALDKIVPSADELKFWIGVKWSLMEVHARAAEVEGRKLDALLLYRDALAARVQSPRPGADDTIKEGMDRLTKELGGSPVTLTLLMDKPKVTEATGNQWLKPANPLPASISLTDLQGKNWKLASYQGKAVLVNIWASWCGPCKMEHPEFQKLYDKFKDRTDVAVVSFNVDDDLGKVAPYMKENNYTFPVILGREVVDAVVPELAIPRNWFITPQGKLEWEQLGYGGDMKWQEMIVAKLDEVLKQSRQEPAH